jgi:hypothetical protein
MNKLDINGINIVTSFLQPCDIKRLGSISKNSYNYCRQFMTYMYNEYGDDPLYYNMNGAKWIVDKCTCEILIDCINKKLNLAKITFDNHFGDNIDSSIEALATCTNLQQISFGSCFDQSIEALTACTNLQQISFGTSFDQSIEALAACTNLQQITFGYAFNQSIEHLQHCATLKQITFGDYFNQSIEPLQHCATLKQITFGSHFNQSIEPLQYCKKLQQITFYLGIDEYKNQLMELTGADYIPFQHVIKLYYSVEAVSDNTAVLRDKLPNLKIITESSSLSCGGWRRRR